MNIRIYEKFYALPVEERWLSAAAFAESCVAWEADQGMRMLLGNYQESSEIAIDVAAPVLRATLQTRAKKGRRLGTQPGSALDRSVGESGGTFLA